jgi:hypothetical protein
MKLMEHIGRLAILVGTVLLVWKAGIVIAIAVNLVAMGSWLLMGPTILGARK